MVKNVYNELFQQGTPYLKGISYKYQAYYCYLLQPYIWTRLHYLTLPQNLTDSFPLEYSIICYCKIACKLYLICYADTSFLFYNRFGSCCLYLHYLISNPTFLPTEGHSRTMGIFWCYNLL